MKVFIVERYETHVQKIEVEAENQVAAIKAVNDGDGQEIGLPKYLEVNEDAGMSCQDFTSKELEALEMSEEDFIPSIRSVKELKGRK
jgi:hypothetical protein